ncbi:MAG TPA: Fic family protein [Coriobacteriia bacterium]|nr:Fic family protein [Coriobacteriia bacterium]
MAKVVRRHWQSEASAGLPRKDRQSCEYEAYVPDPLMGRAIALEGAVAADVANAEAAITRLNREARTLVDTEALARLLLRAEAVASSKIEGLEIGPRRLLEAEAMFYAVRSVRSDEELTLEQLLEIHRRLLAGSRLEESGGKIRSQQNWIGGSSYNPCSAAFVPPPPELVHDLLLDLCRFCNDDSLPAVVQAALAHAQFETIHPFIDGNGRTGRALIHLTLRRRGLAPRVLPPVSLVLATWATDYVAALDGTRYRGQPASPAAHEGLNRWVGLFATACRRAVHDAAEFAARTRGLEAAWRERLGAVRANSATDLLLHALPGAPVLTVRSAADLISRSLRATNEAIARLSAAEVLTQVTVGRRNRAFEARELIDVFTDLERQLASPRGDTRLASPSRRVPRRR